jgi:hypothetical protein
VTRVEMVVVAMVVTTVKMIIMKIGLSGIKKP